tara:strand:+ start:1218 stop:1463 length:246 start_codon:yes stop_codon:yes gene_type:complete
MNTKFTKGDLEVDITDGDVQIVSHENAIVIADYRIDTNEDISIANATLASYGPKMYEFIETHMGGYPEAEELLSRCRGELL